MDDRLRFVVELVDTQVLLQKPNAIAIWPPRPPAVHAEEIAFDSLVRARLEFLESLEIDKPGFDGFGE